MGAARSMRRRTGRSRAAVGNPGSRSATSLFSPLTDDLIGAMRPLLEAPDPAVAEFVASDLLGACTGAAGRLGMLLGAAMEEVIAHGLVDDLVERGSRAAQAALLALGAVAPDSVARRARAAARHLGDRGIAGPAWADAVEKPPSLVRAMRASDAYGDVDGLLLTFVRHGLGEQHVIVLVDHGLGGLAKDAILLNGDRGLRGWLDHMAGLDVGDVEVCEAAGIVRHGMQLADACPPGPPIDDDYWSTRALLAAWLRHAPGVDSDDRNPRGREARAELLDAFLASQSRSGASSWTAERCRSTSRPRRGAAD
jgi:hypothetical protein